jgi:hypothetical protein
MPDGAEPITPADSRRAMDRELFLTFALAAAELLVEVTPEGRVAFAAGAFQSRLGQPPEAWLGRPVRELVALADRAAFDTGFSLLLGRDRMAPTAFRLNDAAGTRVSIGGLRRPRHESRNICLTIAAAPQGAARPALADAAEVRRSLETDGGTGSLGLIEIEAARPEAAAMIDEHLTEALPASTLATALSQGRYGVIGQGLEVGALGRKLEGLLQEAGHAASVNAASLPLEAPGLTPMQATRALRYALSTFGRGGVAAVSEAGFDHELNGFVTHAYARAAGLRRAIAESRFRLAFQPIVALSTGEAHHHEALIRP